MPLIKPQQLEAERALISCLLENAELFYTIEGTLLPERFFGLDNAEVYKAFVELLSQGHTPDIILIKNFLGEENKLELIGGDAYFEQLKAIEHLTSNINLYVKLILDTAILRDVIDTGAEIREAGYNKTAEEALGVVFNKADSLLNSSSLGVDSQAISELAAAEFQALVERLKNPGCDGIPTGFADYDLLTGGLYKTDQIIIAARPSMGKCLGKGTKVLMFSGALKVVEDICPGDQLMGPDSKPRNVLSTTSGEELMYWIHQLRGIDYRVNESHVLSLKRSKAEGKWKHGDIFNIPVEEAHQKPVSFFSRFKGYKTEVSFSERGVSLEPYFLGLWLGDGSSASAKIWATEEEIVSYLHKYAERRNENVSIGSQNRSCPSYLITGGRTQKARDNSVQAILRKIGTLNNKHIPENYLINSKAKRLELLAGLIDSDGYLNDNVTYEITMKREKLMRQIKFLCDSLGYSTTLTSRIARIREIGYECKVWRLRFSGNVSEIPVRLARKKAKLWTSNRNWKMTGLSIEPDRVDVYYGFELDGDGLFLLEDMTVTHNTTLALRYMLNLADRVPCMLFSYEMSRQQLLQRMFAMESGVNLTKIKTGMVNTDEYSLVADAAKKVGSLPIYLNNNPIASVAEVVTEARKMIRKKGVGIVVVDYIQLMPYSVDNATQDLGNISRRLKNLAMGGDITVVVLSQLNRLVELRSDKIPILSDLRQSGNLEEHADIVLMLRREEFYMPTPENRGVADFYIRKNRNGPIGSLLLEFLAGSVDFAGRFSG